MWRFQQPETRHRSVPIGVAVAVALAVVALMAVSLVPAIAGGGSRSAGAGKDSAGAGAATLTGVDVRDFGATGDGVTDDAPAIRRALAAAESVHVPAGTYVLNSYQEPRPARLDADFVFVLRDGQAITAEPGAVFKMADGVIASPAAWGGQRVPRRHDPGHHHQGPDPRHERGQQPRSPGQGDHRLRHLSVRR